MRTKVDAMAWGFMVPSCVVPAAWMMRGIPLFETRLTATHLLLAGGLAVSCYTDIRWKKIRNWITYPTALWALALSALAGRQTDWAEAIASISLAEALAGGATCFSLLFVVYLHGGCGAGDVKLALAIGTVLGIQAGVNVLFMCHAIAGCYLVVLLLKYFCTQLVVGGAWRLLGAGGVYVVLWQAAQTAGGQLQRPVPMAAFFTAGYLLTCLGWRLI